MIHYRNYKNFEKINFRQDLLLKFEIKNDQLSKLNDTVLSILDKHAPKNKLCTFKQIQFYDKRSEKSN